MTIENDDGNGYLELAMNSILPKFQVTHKRLGLWRIVGLKPKVFAFSNKSSYWCDNNNRFNESDPLTYNAN